MDNNRAGEFTGLATANPARDGPLVPDLLTRARTGDKQAWDALVERNAPLIWSICGTYQLGRADAQDVGQRFWLRLVDHRDKIVGFHQRVEIGRHDHIGTVPLD